MKTASTKIKPRKATRHWSLLHRVAKLGVTEKEIISYLKLFVPNWWNFAFKPFDWQAQIYGVDQEENPWSTSSRFPLTIHHILDHLLERKKVIATIRYSEQFGAPALVFDIDAKNPLQKETLSDRFHFIRKLFPFHSLIFQSSTSGGIHVVYPLVHRVPLIIVNRIEKQIGSLIVDGLEIFPQERHPLRLPLGPGSCLLDENLEPMDGLETDKKASLELIHEFYSGNRLNWLNLFTYHLPKYVPSVSIPPSKTNSIQSKARVYIPLLQNYTATLDIQTRKVEALAALENGIVAPGTRNETMLRAIQAAYMIGVTDPTELQVTIERWIIEKNNGQSKDYNQNPGKAIKQVEAAVRCFFRRGCKVPSNRITRLKDVQLSPDEQASIETAADHLRPDLPVNRRREFCVALALFIKRQLEKGQPIAKIEIPKEVFLRCGGTKKGKSPSYYGRWQIILERAGLVIPSDPTWSTVARRSKAYSVKPLLEWKNLSSESSAFCREPLPPKSKAPSNRIDDRALLETLRTSMKGKD